VFVVMVTNRYKSSPIYIAVAHGTSTKFGTRFRLFTTIHSVSENDNIRHFFVIVQYETYADRFVRLVEMNYLMFVFMSFKTSLIRKVNYL